MPRWGERMDQLESALYEIEALNGCPIRSYHRGPGIPEHEHIGADAYFACNYCHSRPIRDPYREIRATAAQGAARPGWSQAAPADEQQGG